METGMAIAATPRRVLVVEDDESLRGALERLLGLAGFSAAACASAEAVLAGGLVGGAACVVCDLRLPGMSGLELLAVLRAQGWRTPLVLITAFDEPGLAEKAEGLGAAGYLVKPFHGTALLSAVRAAIAPPGAATATRPDEAGAGLREREGHHATSSETSHPVAPRGRPVAGRVRVAGRTGAGGEAEASEHPVHHHGRRRHRPAPEDIRPRR
jgi:FixJ family two-component response regulator